MFSIYAFRKVAFLLPVFLMAGLAAMAQPKPPSSLTNPLAQVMVIIMVLLALCIALLANVVNSATAMYCEKLRQERDAKSGTIAAGITAFLMLAGPMAAMAQTAQAAAQVIDSSINGLTPLVFYLMVGVITVEIIILVALVYQLRFLIGLEAKEVIKVAVEVEPEKPKVNWWWKINKSTDIAHEQDIDLSHDYDGISELDNKLPPWWSVAFGITIFFSVVYLYRYHVSESAPLQIEELNLAIKKGEAEKMAYLTKNASNVDENTVTMLDAGAIASGQALFAANCIACHGTVGEGNAVGPNLTDDYWIHGGAIADVFKTIKYGVVEKGMRSWKDDLSPIQMAQVSSYVKSLRGSNPPNPKEQQGNKYEEAPAGSAKADSTNITKL